MTAPMLPEHWTRPPPPRAPGLLERWIAFWNRHRWIGTLQYDPTGALLWNLFVIGFLAGHGAWPDVWWVVAFHVVTNLLWVGFVLYRIVGTFVGSGRRAP